MTEEEAKTKWCPFAVASHTDPRGRSGYSREEIGLPADTFTHACIGSSCMAWRTADAPRETLRNYHDDPEIMGHFVGGERVFPHGWQYQHTDKDRAGRKFDLLHRIAADDALATGFCGLAGRPA